MAAVDVAHELYVPVVVALRDESEGAAVRRPGRRGVLEIAVGQPAHLAGAVRGDDEQVLPTIARPADVVELVAHAGEAPGAPFLLVLLLVGLVADARAEGEL